MMILDRYENEPGIAFWAMSTSLWKLVRALPPEILERAKRIDKAACDHVIRL